MGKERTYIYKKDKTDSQTRLVTSIGGHEIPSNCEVLIVFSNKVTDADIEHKMEKLREGGRGNFGGSNRFVLVCGQPIRVKIRQSYLYQEKPTVGDLPPEVMRWLNGEISQTGEEIARAAQPTRAMPPHPVFIAQTARTIPQLTAFSTQTARTVPQLTAFSTQTARAVPQPMAFSTQTARAVPQPMAFSTQTARAVPQPMAFSTQTARTVPQPMAFSTQTARTVPERESQILDRLKGLLPQMQLDLIINKGIIEKILGEESKSTQIAFDNNDLLQLQTKYFGKFMDIIHELKTEYKTLLYQAELKQIAERKQFLDKQLEALIKKTIQPTPDLFFGSDAEACVPVSVQTTISEKEDEDEIEYRCTRDLKRNAELLSSQGLFSSSSLVSKRIKTESYEEIDDENGLIIDESETEDDDENTQNYGHSFS